MNILRNWSKNIIYWARDFNRYGSIKVIGSTDEDDVEMNVVECNPLSQTSVLER